MTANMASISSNHRSILYKTIYSPGCIPCKVYAEDTPILTIDSIVICQTHAEDLRRRLLKMHPGIQPIYERFCRKRNQDKFLMELYELIPESSGILPGTPELGGRRGSRPCCPLPGQRCPSNLKDCLGKIANCQK
jgi:hypothetical protein